MSDFRLMRALQQRNETKIVMLVIDGLGGLAIGAGGPTELESARTPNLDRLAAEATLGQTIPIGPGITPGSGPAHHGLFGYDPLTYEVGRGVLESIGVGMEVRRGDVAARGNLCTVDDKGKIRDRRAGRIPTEAASPIVERLKEIRVAGVETEVQPVREYRFAMVMRGEGLEAQIADTDPQRTGAEPLLARALDPGSERAAAAFNSWIGQARQVLAGEPQANALTLRGFSTDPALPQFPEVFGLRAACLAVYPMYKGVARLVGMQIEAVTGDTPADEVAALADVWDPYDFFFVHIKKADSRGEDGDFAGKVAVLEAVDAALPGLLDLGPAVLAVTGDHSTPARMKTHTWHPVPFLLWAPATARADDQTAFSETACVHGGLGTFPAKDAMPLLMAHAGRLAKFGA
jgi:2,3-bisphosphoglycerate-independent phosphoglycerate mutase